MGLSLGIVGLPNVGKSTLFNALTNLQVDASAYPFCTIEPNVGIVEVPDERIQKIAEIIHPQQTLSATVKFVDIAGLVKGASEGEGLGNKFLTNIREVDAIVHVVRFFEDSNVTHTAGKIDPKDDLETINLELILSDMDVIVKRLDTEKSKLKAGAAPDQVMKVEALQKIFDALEANKLAKTVILSKEEEEALKDLQLLTNKPVLYLANVDETSVHLDGKAVQEKLGVLDPVVVMCNKLEMEISRLSPEEKPDFLATYELTEPGLHKLIRAGYDLLGLQTYFTAGEKEVRAWTIHKGWKAPEAAGVIHTDFTKGFIRVEAIGWKEFVDIGGWTKAREKGLVRSEGKEYIMNDGDVCLFRFNV